MNIARALAEGGGYNLPFLLHLYDPTGTQHIYLINDNADYVYNGVTYLSSNFTYNPNRGGDSNLSIELVEHDEIIDLLENNYFFNVDVIGILNGEEVEEIGQYFHKYGEGTWSGAKLEIKLNKDDRGEMTFQALTLNSDNNRGGN
jgi:hypothetical protein